MDNRIGYATAGFFDRDIDAALDVIADVGFNQTELFCDTPHVAPPPNDADARAFAKRLDRLALGTTLHAPLGRCTLGMIDDERRRQNVEVFAAYLRFGGIVGATDMVVHALPAPDDLPEPADPQVAEHITDAVRRSVDELLDAARDASVRILLENLPARRPMPLRTMRELRQFVDDYPPDLVGLVIDVGHAATLRLDPAAEIYAAGDRLCGTHLQDVDPIHPADNHWLPTHGGLDWPAIRTALADIHYTGPWTFEVINSRHGETPDELCRLAHAIARSWT